MPDFVVLPDGTRERRLVKPLQSYDQRAIEVVRLRPPRYRDIMRLGDPSSLVIMNGAVLPQNDFSVIAGYFDALLIDERGDAIRAATLEEADYRDVIALKDAVLDFFRQASASTSTGTPTL
jgi:hypothetical protein